MSIKVKEMFVRVKPRNSADRNEALRGEIHDVLNCGESQFVKE